MLSKLFEEFAGIVREMENLTNAKALQHLENLKGVPEEIRKINTRMDEFETRLKRLEEAVFPAQAPEADAAAPPEGNGPWIFHGDHRLEPTQGDLIRGAFHWAGQGKLKPVTNEQLAKPLGLTIPQVCAAKAYLSGKLATKSRRTLPTIEQTKKWLEDLKIAV